MKAKKQFLVSFYYQVINIGYDEAFEYALVSASSFDAACCKIAKKYYRARDFKNLTIE